jgi:NhaP-type Na+/H+ or K+/H+ antiporter
VLALVLVVVLGGAVLTCSVLARHWRVAPPLLLLASGVLLGFIPALRDDVHLPPEAVLLLFLPALLYSAMMVTTLKGHRPNDSHPSPLAAEVGLPATCWAFPARCWSPVAGGQRARFR